MDEPTKTFFLDMKAKINYFYSTFRLYRALIAKSLTDKEKMDDFMKSRIHKSPLQNRESGIKTKGLLKMKHVSIPEFDDNKKEP